MKYCNSILHELSFHLEKIIPCCTPFCYNVPEYFNIKNGLPKNDTINFNHIIYNLINNLNKNINEYSCKNCINLADDDKDIINIAQDCKYNSIYLRHFTSCNANCVHCDNHRSNDYGITSKYNPCKIIKRAYEENLIDSENLVIRFQGGDIGVLENFSEFIDLFLQYGFKTIYFSTNNIIYQPKIEEILKLSKGSLNVSIDAGTCKTYEKIKRVDKFNECIDNLKKYLSVGIHPDAISIHYIIIQGYNDSKKEIYKFLKLMKSIGISTVGVRIDHKDLNSYLLKNASI